MRAHKKPSRKSKKSLAYYPSHPDVIWDDDDMVPETKVRQIPTKKAHLKLVEVDSGREPTPFVSKVMPGTRIDRTFGLCSCWLCCNRSVPKYEENWMFGVLAKDALRKRELDRRLWLQDWTLRHGKFAGAVLNRHIDWIISLNGEHRA